jgi:hypothetical protein
MTGLLIILLVLHCFWFKTVLEICVNAITGGVVSDIREVSEGCDNVATFPHYDCFMQLS